MILIFTANISADRLSTDVRPRTSSFWLDGISSENGQMEQGRIQEHKRCGKLLTMGGGRETTASGRREGDRSNASHSLQEKRKEEVDWGEGRWKGRRLFGRLGEGKGRSFSGNKQGESLWRRKRWKLFICPLSLHVSTVCINIRSSQSIKSCSSVLPKWQHTLQTLQINDKTFSFQDKYLNFASWTLKQPKLSFKVGAIWCISLC